MIRKIKKMMAAVAAAGVLVSLAGCSRVPEGYVPEGYVPEGYVPEGYVPAGYISIEDAQALFSALTLPVGYLDGTSEEISKEEGDEISQEALAMESSFVAADAPQVRDRDWSVYTSQLARKDLIFEEAAFYDRLDELCRRYMDSAALDGIRRENSDSFVSDTVRFGDLNLTKEQAVNLAFWFKYNNPQYYFISSSVGTTSSQHLYFHIYDFAADGEERVKITNELFDKLDGWIESADTGGATTWEKEFSANNLLCKNIFYNNEYVDNHDLMGQTLYSAVMLEGTVCAGYAAAFSAIMNALDVETTVVLSPTHAWNVVQYDDGNYYAVDVTWNDDDEDDNNPKNEYFNVGETTLKMGDGGAHTYSARYVAWTPDISTEDCSDEGQGSSVVRLEAPQNLHVASHEDGKVHFAWDSVEGAAGYGVELYDRDMTKALNSRQVEGPTVSVTYGSRTSFAIRVRAEAGDKGAEGMSGWSEFLPVEMKESSESEGIKPAVPENVKVDRDEPRNAAFSWDPVEEADQYEFVLFKDSEHKETWASSFKTKPSVGYSKLQPGTTYYFGVRAMKTVEGTDYYSDWNYFSHETPKESSESAVSDKLAAPENIQVAANGEEKVKITWGAVAVATGYQFCLYKDPEYKEVWKEFSKTDPEINLKGIEKGNTYYCAVRAVKTTDGKEVYSEWVTYVYTHTGEIESAQLAAPANFKVVYIEENAARATWDAVPEATGYQFCLYKDPEYKEVWLEKPTTSPKLKVKNMKDGRTYYCAVRAVKSADGQEVYSDWVYFSYIFFNDSSEDLIIHVQ